MIEIAPFYIIVQSGSMVTVLVYGNSATPFPTALVYNVQRSWNDDPYHSWAESWPPGFIGVIAK